MDNQDFFAAAHGRGAPCRWELSVKEVNQATKRPTESGSSSSTNSTMYYVYYSYYYSESHRGLQSACRGPQGEQGLGHGLVGWPTRVAGQREIPWNWT